MISNRQLFLNYVAQTSDSPLLLEVDRAEGVYLFDKSGKKYYDLISGISVSNVGHCHPRVIEAIDNQVRRYMHLMVYGEYVQSPQVILASKLIQLLPSNLDNIFFVNSGSEAVEGVIKLAKRYTGRSEIVSFHNAYHGSTAGAISIMGNEEQKRAFRPLLPDVKFLRYNNFDDLNKITSKTACVIIEPVQGEAGVRVPDAAYLKDLRAICNEFDVLLAFDEIQTGLGRTGKMFAFERYGVVPDIIILAKALGGGMPLGAFISSSKIMRVLSYNPVLGHITTFGGHPVCCSAAVAALEVIQDNNLVDTAIAKAEIFKEYLINHSKVKDFRYSGLLMAVELESFELVKRVIALGLEKGIILDWFLFCNNSFRIAPPLIITEEECHNAAKIITNVLDIV